MADIDAALLAAMEGAEKAGQKFGKIRYLRAGRHVIQILPNKDLGPVWFRQFGTHWFKPATPGGKGQMYVCNSITHETPCKVCAEIEKAKKSAVPGMAEAADDASSYPRYLANAILQDEDPNKVILFGLNKTLIGQFFQVTRMVNPRFFDLQQNIAVVIRAFERVGRKGLDYKIEGVMNPIPVPVGVDALNDLDESISQELSNALSPDAFVSIPGVAPTMGGIPGMMPVGAAPYAPLVAPTYPALTAPPTAVAQPVMATTVMPAGPTPLAPTPPATPVLAPAPAVAPVAQAAPAVTIQGTGNPLIDQQITTMLQNGQPVEQVETFKRDMLALLAQTVTAAAPAAPVAAPTPVAAVVQPPLPVAPVAAPVAAPAAAATGIPADQASALHAKLLAMTAGS